MPEIGAAAAPVPDMIVSPQPRVLGKRRRGVDDALKDGGQETIDDHRPCPRKKGKAKMAVTAGVLEADKPAARTQSRKNQKSKALGRGAERLATSIVQGVSDRSRHGPSVQQGLTGAIAQEQMPRVEGSAEGVTVYHVDSMAPKDDNVVDNMKDSKSEEAESGALFYIPKTLDTRHKALLDATSDDWARGTVRVLKCRLCPGAGFSNWEIFRRHCNTMEAHPDKISFCEHCGDFFARSDSLIRHYDRRPQECRNASPAMAGIKRRETERVHADCEEKLKCSLKTNEDIGKPFAQIIKEMYPESSKRGSRQQNRLKEPRWRR